MNEDIFSTFQAAKYCHVHHGTIKNWIKNGLLKAYKTPGGHYRIAKKDIDTFLSEQGMAPETPQEGEKIFPTVNKAKVKILIIDDDYSIRKGIEKTLEKYKEKYEVKSAADGYEAGKILPAFKPDLLILDLVMPWMDGFNVCERIRNILPSSTKIICLTGFPGDGNRERILKAGADVCLNKPIEREILLKQIETLLGNHVE